jgi:hypothetical protein
LLLVEQVAEGLVAQPVVAAVQVVIVQPQVFLFPQELPTQLLLVEAVRQE